MSVTVARPKCFSYVMSNRDYQEKMNAIPIEDCKECGIMKDCVTAYNARVYDIWCTEWYEGRQDDEGWEDIQ